MRQNMSNICALFFNVSEIISCTQNSPSVNSGWTQSNFWVTLYLVKAFQLIQQSTRSDGLETSYFSSSDPQFSRLGGVLPQIYSDFSRIAKPMTELLRKDVKFKR